MKTVFTLGKYIVIAGLLVTVVMLVLNHKTEQDKILVVHSYHTDLVWVNQVDDGINRAKQAAIDAGLREPNVRTHYMNLRNHPDCDYFEIAADDVRFTIEDWKPNVVILVDDLAQGLIGFPHLKLHSGADRSQIAQNVDDMFSGLRCDSDIPSRERFGLDLEIAYKPDIVFAGVNGGVERYGYPQASNVSGIFERKNYAALTETLQDLATAYRALHPDNPDVVIGIKMLNDDSPTGRTESERYLEQTWTGFTPFPPVNAHTFDDWKQAVETANQQDIMLLIANYENVMDDAGKVVPPDMLIKWTERHAELPVLGANTRFVADGGLMTIAISGTEQGDVAMKLALAILQNDLEHLPECQRELATTDPLRPQCEARQYLIGMNQALVKKRKLDLPSIYQAFSREIGMFFLSALEEVYREQDGVSE